MSDSQRKALIIQAFHAKKQLQDELSEAKEQVNTHKQQLEQLKIQVTCGPSLDATFASNLLAFNCI